jgi:hypothetical protein
MPIRDKVYPTTTDGSVQVPGSFTGLGRQERSFHTEDKGAYGIRGLVAVAFYSTQLLAGYYFAFAGFLLGGVLWGGSETAMRMTELVSFFLTAFVGNTGHPSIREL